MSIGEGSALIFLQRPMSLALVLVVLSVLLLPRLFKLWSARRQAALPVLR
jgi:putative tricarboxylic transport membrane protein